MKFEHKKLLILGGNAETVPLVQVANSLGVETIVSSSNPDSMAKACAVKKYDIDATDVASMVALAKAEYGICKREKACTVPGKFLVASPG